MGRHDMFGTKNRDKKGLVMFKKDGELYGKMKILTKSERAVLDFIIKNMAEDMNQIIIGLDTKDALLGETGINPRTLSNILSKLYKEGFIDKGFLPNEYLVDPRLAVSGSEDKVYAFFAKVEEELVTRKKSK